MPDFQQSTQYQSFPKPTTKTQELYRPPSHANSHSEWQRYNLRTELYYVSLKAIGCKSNLTF